LRPEVVAYAPAVDALHTADEIIICPGDLYSSIIPVLLPRGVKDALIASTARITVVLNIMTKSGETDNYTADDFLTIIEKYIGRTADQVIYNTSDIPESALLNYALENKVEINADAHAMDSRYIGAPLLGITQTGHIYTDSDALRVVFEQLCTDRG
jgi:uncharacterized cofD-like protein